MSDLVINVRQIGNYSPLSQVFPTDTLLLQRGGLGGAYYSAPASTLISTALNTGSMPVGMLLPGDAQPGQFIAAQGLAMGMGGGLGWNAYLSTAGGLRSWQGSSQSALLGVSGAIGLAFAWGTSTPGAALAWTNLFTVSPAGAANLPLGTLTVARDPAAASEVATMGWVGRNTVASFNGRRGAVSLAPADIYRALCLDSPIASHEWVCETIKASVEMLLRSHPFVFGWNGRTGDVWLTLADITCCFMAPGQQPVAPNPPAGSQDNSIATTAWVSEYVSDIITGEIASQGLATQAWVQANTVASFNTRQGAVTLTLADITGAGGAPIASPNFTGIPIAPTAIPGTSSAQLATTAFVMAAVTAATTGVISFNSRTGAVILTTTDINNAGGALLLSPNFSGTPSAPTAAPGTSSGQLATTAFVQAAIAAATAGVASFNGRTGDVVLDVDDIEAAGGAPAASPALTGTPTAPTAPNGTSTTQIATTAFVMDEIAAVSAGVTTFNGRSGVVVLNANDISGAGGLANPSAQLTGTPTAPTPAPGDDSTNIATTAFVVSAIAGLSGNYLPLTGGTVSGPVIFNGASATLTLAANAASAMQAVPLQQLTTALASYAPLASPALSGTPTAPTAAAATNNTQVATTAFVTAAIATAIAGVGAGYVPIAGNVTMTGPFSLSQNAGAAMQPVPLQQMNAAIAALSGTYVPLVGNSTITGNLSIASGGLNSAATAQIGGNGVVYSTFATAAIAFTWSGGYLNLYVNGAYIISFAGVTG